MDNTPPSTRRFKGWHLSKKLSTFPKKYPKVFANMKELDSYCGTTDHNIIYAYVKDYHTCSGIFTQAVNAGMDISYFTLGRFEKWHV